ncbi:MAG: glycosyltransferase family 2 protein [Sphaerochaetaceae bacterium]|nr:glycosyltransferase family 2 protein [Sphaerochaetaceae bacterium]
MTTTLSVLLVSYNTKEETARSLDSILYSTSDMTREIMVTDNGSSDGSAGMIEHAYPDVILRKNKSNRYFAPALNEMLKDTHGKYVMLVNSDLYVNEQAVIKIIEYLDDNSECGIASCRIDHGSAEEGGYAGYNFWRIPTLGSICSKLYPFKFFRDRLRSKSNEASKEIKGPLEVEVISDAFMVLRGEPFREMKGFSEGLRLYYTEDDICIRFRKQGFKVYFIPSVSVRHDSGSSTRKHSFLKTSMVGVGDILAFSRKHLGLVQYLALLPIMLFHCCALIMYALVKKSRRHGK